MTHPALRVQILGGFSIDYGGSPVVLRPERAQSLLAYLMLRKGTAQRRAHLAALLWPDSSDALARTNLRKLVLEIRRALPQA
jgi:DNA-binding SARP family transcriptional activator